MDEFKRWIATRRQPLLGLEKMVAWLDRPQSDSHVVFLKTRINGYLSALRDVGVISGEQHQTFEREVSRV